MRKDLHGAWCPGLVGLVFFGLAILACSTDDRPRALSGARPASSKQSPRSPSTTTKPLSLPSAPDASVKLLDGMTDAPEVLAATQNILLVGFDRDEHGVGRTDAILMLAMSRDEDAAALVSVPRDLWIRIPGGGEGRINSVYRIGELRSKANGGRTLLREVIRRELGIRIDGSVEVDFSGFVRIVDLLGGIPVRVACPIEDRFIDYDHPGQPQTLSLEAGLNHIDGRTALLFSRSRHGRGDYDRARRQQAVLLGLRTRALSVDGLARLPALWDEVSRSVTTDLEAGTALAVATRLLRMRAWKIHGLVLGEPYVEEWRTSQKQDVLVPNRDAVAKALEGLFEDPLPGANPSSCPAKDIAIVHHRQPSLPEKTQSSPAGN